MRARVRAYANCAYTAGRVRISISRDFSLSLSRFFLYTIALMLTASLSHTYRGTDIIIVPRERERVPPPPLSPPYIFPPLALRSQPLCIKRVCIVYAPTAGYIHSKRHFACDPAVIIHLHTRSIPIVRFIWMIPTEDQKHRII